LVAAAVATIALLQLARSVPPSSGSPGPTDVALLARGQPAPNITGTSLDGTAFSLASLRGRPVIVNFWGPSCVPCRDEFPLLLDKLSTHASDGLAVVGVLMYDAAAPARDFVAQYKATWPTIDDPAGAIRNAYRVAARPQSYFIDRDGILRSIQVGQLTDLEFERQYALIAGAPAAIGPGPSGGQPRPSIEIPPNP
jgi:cytochrome c biogenesis protein CcmG/thiol:disulfide interchange protein DsbE